MANSNFQGVGYAGWNSSPPELIEECNQRGTVVRMFDTYVLTADLASGDKIRMGGPIQEGSVLLDCILSADALGGSCTINVGWEAVAEYAPTGADTLEVSNATGFFSALPVSSATVALAHGSTYEGGGGGATGSSFYRKRLTSPIQVIVAENAVSSGATGKSISVEVSYIAI